MPRKFGGSPKCANCGKSAYQNESISIDGHTCHKTCFKCATCEVRLTLGTYVLHGGNYFCTKHKDAGSGLADPAATPPPAAAPIPVTPKTSPGGNGSPRRTGGGTLNKSPGGTPKKSPGGNGSPGGTPKKSPGGIPKTSPGGNGSPGGTPKKTPVGKWPPGGTPNKSPGGIPKNSPGGNGSPGGTPKKTPGGKWPSGGTPNKSPGGTRTSPGGSGSPGGRPDMANTLVPPSQGAHPSPNIPAALPVICPVLPKVCADRFYKGTSAVVWSYENPAHSGSFSEYTVEQSAQIETAFLHSVAALEAYPTIVTTIAGPYVIRFEEMSQYNSAGDRHRPLLRSISPAKKKGGAARCSKCQAMDALCLCRNSSAKGGMKIQTNEGVQNAMAYINISPHGRMKDQFYYGSEGVTWAYGDWVDRSACIPYSVVDSSAIEATFQSFLKEGDVFFVKVAEGRYVVDFYSMEQYNVKTMKKHRPIVRLGSALAKDKDAPPAGAAVASPVVSQARRCMYCGSLPSVCICHLTTPSQDIAFPAAAPSSDPPSTSSGIPPDADVAALRARIRELELEVKQERVVRLREEEMYERRLQKVSSQSMEHQDQFRREMAEERERTRQLVATQQELEQKLVEEKGKRERLAIDRRKIITIEQPLPPYWRSDYPIPDYREVVLAEASEEFQMVSEMLNASMNNINQSGGTVGGQVPSSFKVVELLRIQNQPLWNEYCYKKQSIKDRNGGAVPREHLSRFEMILPCLDEEANEYWLFHGTDAETVGILTKSGYDNRLCSVNGVFGRGFYLAENATKSNSYIPCSGCGGGAKLHGRGSCQCTVQQQQQHLYYLVLYRAVLGDPHVAMVYDKATYRGNPKKCRIVNRPPQKPDSYDTYDCVLGEKQEFQGPMPVREIILYERGQAYPEYVIAYQRKLDVLPPVQSSSVLSKAKGFLRRAKEMRVLNKEFTG